MEEEIERINDAIDEYMCIINYEDKEESKLIRKEIQELKNKRKELRERGNN